MVNIKQHKDNLSQPLMAAYVDRPRLFFMSFLFPYTMVDEHLDLSICPINPYQKLKCESRLGRVKPLEDYSGNV